MFHPELTAEIARQHQQRLASRATARRAAKRVWFVVPRRMSPEGPVQY